MEFKPTTSTITTQADPLDNAEVITMKNNFEEQEIQRVDEQQVEEHEQIANSNESTADSILKSAKEDGFEEALQKLAEGEFDEKADDVFEVQTPDLLEELVIDQEVVLEEPVNPETGYIVERIKELEVRVINLEQKNKELSERLRNSENLNIMSIFTLAEIARILAEMIKEEEKGEEKVSLLEILVEVLQEIFQAIVDPNGEHEEEQNESQNTSNEEEKNPRRTLLEIVEKLQAEGQIRTNQQIQLDVHSAKVA